MFPALGNWMLWKMVNLVYPSDVNYTRHVSSIIHGPTIFPRDVSFVLRYLNRLTDGRTETCTKIIITTGRECESAEWISTINRLKKKNLQVVACLLLHIVSNILLIQLIVQYVWRVSLVIHQAPCNVIYSMSCFVNGRTDTMLRENIDHLNGMGLVGQLMILIDTSIRSLHYELERYTRFIELGSVDHW